MAHVSGITAAFRPQASHEAAVAKRFREAISGRGHLIRGPESLYDAGMDADGPSLSPLLLVSMPQMLDPNFSQTVILLADYGPDGAFGLVVNRRMDDAAHEVVRVEPPIDIRADVHLFVGGPVEPGRAWVLTPHGDLDAEALCLADGVYLSASADLIRLALQSPPDDGLRVVVGYAGWGPGQLDEELAQSAWLTAPIEADIVFETPVDMIWDAVIRRLGADPLSLHGSSRVQ